MENNNQKKNDGKFPGGSTWGVLAILMLVTFLAVSFMNDYWKKSKSEALSYTEFIEMLDNGEIDEVISGNGKITIIPNNKSDKYIGDGRPVHGPGGVLRRSAWRTTTS